VIFRYDEVAAARFGQRFGPRQLRARRGLKTRYGCSSCGALCGLRYSGCSKEKGEQEDLLVCDYAAETFVSSSA
jgi:hypothetical protein